MSPSPACCAVRQDWQGARLGSRHTPCAVIRRGCSPLEHCRRCLTELCGRCKVFVVREYLLGNCYFRALLRADPRQRPLSLIPRRLDHDVQTGFARPTDGLSLERQLEDATSPLAARGGLFLSSWSAARYWRHTRCSTPTTAAPTRCGKRFSMPTRVQAQTKSFSTFLAAASTRFSRSHSCRRLPTH